MRNAFGIKASMHTYRASAAVATGFALVPPKEGHRGVCRERLRTPLAIREPAQLHRLEMSVKCLGSAAFTQEDGRV
jgi:hypothetical protein